MSGLIQFIYHGKRRSLRLAKATKKQITTTQKLVELAIASETDDDALIQKQIREHKKSLPSWINERLERIGLITLNKDAMPSTLEAFADYYVAKQTQAKPATKEIWRQGQKSLVEHFGANRRFATITVGEVKQYQKDLRLQTAKNKSVPISESTVTKRLQFARQLFNFAVDHQVLASSPFSEIKLSAVPAADHEEVTLEMIARVIEEAPNQDWRMVLTLCRHGGLRCPSEVLLLKWSDVNWDKNTMRVRSPKTEHHIGKESRIVPLYPLLRKELDKAFDLATEGAEYVVSNNRWRESAQSESGWRNCNLRTQLEKIIWRAGLKPWAKLFNSMRSSKATDLLDDNFPVHVVAAWQGDKVETLLKHYAKVKGEHVLRAAGLDLKQIRRATDEARCKSAAAKTTEALH